MTEQSYQEPDRLIFCCSGASNVGVLSFQAAIRLANEGYGSFSCIAGIGSGNPQMVRAAKMVDEIILIDGCPIGCGKKIMDANMVPIDRYFVVTKLGIDKTHGFDIEDRDLDCVVFEVKNSKKTERPDNSLLGRRVEPGDDGT